MLVVDLDGGSLLHCYGDEEDIIPKKLQKALVSSLNEDAGKHQNYSIIKVSLFQ